MALVSQSTKNLKGGISQQPDILRFSNQGKFQENGWSSETQGLQKRPPTLFVKRLANAGEFGPAPYIHQINRDAKEQYDVVFTGSGVRVFDLKGIEYEVRGYDYYADTPDPRNDLRMVTVADYTFITNRIKITQMGTEITHESSPKLTQRAIVNVRGGQYGRTLSFGINGFTNQAVLQMPAGDVADYPNPPEGYPKKQVEWTDAGFIARELAKRFNATMTAQGLAYTATAGTGWIMVDAHGGPDITSISTDDGYGGQLLSAFIYQVQTFSKLPASCADGYLVEITGEAARTGDNYWVQYSATDLVWRETARPGIVAGIDKWSMPKGLVRAADGKFDWITLAFENRKCGDDDTNPMPSFIGQPINEIFFFRNRLGFLSGENVIMSRTSKYYNFFPSSVSQVSDDDPIDVAISHNRVSILKYAVPFSEQLLLWSDQAQFVLSSSGTLTSKSIQLDLTTEFDVSDGARPFGIGRGVYFASPRASYASVKRYYAVQDVSDVKSAEDISAHIPSYIRNTVHTIHGSGTENFVSVLSDKDPSKVFIYKFLYVDERLVQQSWSHWTFGDNVKVLSANCIGSFMYLIIERSTGITMERIEFTENTVDIEGEPYRTYMDMKISVEVTEFNEDLYESYVDVETLYGGPLDASAVLYTVDKDGSVETHRTNNNWTTNNRITLNGDRRGETLTVGREYVFTYVFSKLLIKQEADDGSSSTEDSGRLQLRKAWVNYEASGSFTVSVHNGSTEYRYSMSGGRLGTEIYLGRLGLGTGQFKFPVSGNALAQTVTITSANPNPLNIIGCGWEGNYIRRTAGI